MFDISVLAQTPQIAAIPAREVAVDRATAAAFDLALAEGDLAEGQPATEVEGDPAGACFPALAPPMPPAVPMEAAENAALPRMVGPPLAPPEREREPGPETAQPALMPEGAAQMPMALAQPDPVAQPRMLDRPQDPPSDAFDMRPAFQPDGVSEGRTMAEPIMDEGDLAHPPPVAAAPAPGAAILQEGRPEAAQRMPAEGGAAIPLAYLRMMLDAAPVGDPPQAVSGQAVAGPIPDGSPLPGADPVVMAQKPDLPVDRQADPPVEVRVEGPIAAPGAAMTQPDHVVLMKTLDPMGEAAVARPDSPGLHRHLAPTVEAVRQVLHSDSQGGRVVDVTPFPVSDGEGIEIRLDPEELGRVKIALHQEGDALRVTVQAERPETLDLLRRHGDRLAQELRGAGYEGASMSFGGWSQGEGRPSPDLAGHDAILADPSTALLPAGSPPASAPLLRAAGPGLNLRL